MSGSGGRHLRITGSGREALPIVLEWSGGLPECPGMVERVSQISGRSREAIPDVRKWSEDPPVCP